MQKCAKCRKIFYFFLKVLDAACRIKHNWSWRRVFGISCLCVHFARFCVGFSLSGAVPDHNLDEVSIVLCVPICVPKQTSQVRPSKPIRPTSLSTQSHGAAAAAPMWMWMPGARVHASLSLLRARAQCNNNNNIVTTVCVCVWRGVGYIGHAMARWASGPKRRLYVNIAGRHLFTLIIYSNGNCACLWRRRRQRRRRHCYGMHFTICAELAFVSPTWRVSIERYAALCIVSLVVSLGKYIFTAAAITKLTMTHSIWNWFIEKFIFIAFLDRI